MTIWLLVLLLVIAAMGAMVWRSERRRRATHPGSGFGDFTSHGDSAADPYRDNRN